jgi:hypothetical protein
MMRCWRLLISIPLGSEVYQVGEFGTDGVDATQAGAIDPTTGEPANNYLSNIGFKNVKE